MEQNCSYHITMILEKGTELCISYHRYEFYNLRCKGSQIIP